MEMLRFYISWFILLLKTVDIVTAQDRICGNELFDQKRHHWRALHKVDSIFHQFNENTHSYGRENTSISVVVHILWHKPSENISDKQVYKQIEILNQSFNNEGTTQDLLPSEFRSAQGSLGIHFCLASFDPFGVPTQGITRRKVEEETIGISESLFSTLEGGVDAWDPDRYLNIWVANTGNIIAGYGSYPWGEKKDRSGVVIHPTNFGITNNPKFGQGKTLVHEVGHYLGLLHIWGLDENCESDDEVADTPSQKSPNKGCPTHPKSSCGDNEMFMNFMDYVDDECMNIFTNGQINRMKAMIQGFRPMLVQKKSCSENDTIKNPTTNTFPIPAFDHTYLNMDKDGYVKLFDTSGRLIDQVEIEAGTPYRLDTSSYPSGLYIIRYIDRQGRTSHEKLSVVR